MVWQMLRFLDTLFLHFFSQHIQGIYSWGVVLIFQTKLQFLPLIRGAAYSQFSVSVTFSDSPDSHLRELILQIEVFFNIIVITLIIAIITGHKGILWISLAVFNLVSQVLPQPAHLVLKDSFKSRLTSLFSITGLN